MVQLLLAGLVGLMLVRLVAVVVVLVHLVPNGLHVAVRSQSISCAFAA